MKIQVLNNVSEHGLKILKENSFELIKDDQIVEAQGIVLRSYSLRDFALPKSLLAISRAGAGTNNIDNFKCSERGIVVFNTPGANANAVKEMVICALILGKRDLVSGNKTIDSIDTEKLSDSEISKGIEDIKKAFVGQEIRGKTLGVIGLGAIGSMVAEQAIQLGMNVKGYDPGITVETALRLPRDINVCNKIDEAFKNSDYISLHIPLNEKTKGLINRELIQLANKDFVLINFSRAGIVEEKSVVSELDSKQISKYITDFPSRLLIERLADKRDLIIFPHLGASTKESEVNCAIMACQQLATFLSTGKIYNSVNFPNISSEKIGKHRLFIANENTPGVISSIAEVLAKDEINIIEFVNKSREKIACNLIDTNDEISSDTLLKLSNIKGVTNARLCY
tara:strand:- start:801 stop:1991 length:1191 start_codon:yes stop_codon:yes gene_type:complete